MGWEGVGDHRWAPLTNNLSNDRLVLNAELKVLTLLDRSRLEMLKPLPSKSI
jgi:hypothetical protein